jgi:hypothetical protein
VKHTLLQLAPMEESGKPMARVATVVPDETDLLCEGCGYTLNCLPQTGNCPECGKPISESVGIHRSFSEFESHPSLATLIDTTLRVLLHPRGFYSELATRSNTDAALRFTHFHRLLASVLFALAAAGHLLWILQTLRITGVAPLIVFAVAAIVGIPLLYLLLSGLTRLAAWLSAIEARYWGMRLPLPVVRRGMQFHTANYLPVAMLAAALVWGYRLLLETGILSRRFDDIYLYTLCGAVIVSAMYLFRSYWIAMRSMMYANR